MRYISICSGIEAASCAWEELGWEAVAFAEIDPFASAVLKHHYPNVPNLGDISEIDWTPYAGTVDLVVGGTPCQSFSIAGKREGMDGASGIIREYFRLLKEVRPRWFLWENVPGCLSSHGGADFQSILRSWDECGYHVAWTVLDAQFFGVPQRRRRVYAVGHLGNWRYPAEVLFEPGCLCRDTPKGRKAGQEIAGAAGKKSSHWSGGPHPTLNQSSKASGGPRFSDQELFAQGGAGLCCDAMRERENLACGHSSDSQCGIREETMTGEPAHRSGRPVVCTGETARCLVTKTRIDYETETFVCHPNA